MIPPDPWPLAKQLAFALEPETAHRLAVALIGRLSPTASAPPPPGLGVELAGLRWPSPIGMAAGFDKDARAWRGLLALGFGHVEVGTLTPLPQHGNPTPRLFRLAQQRALINRLGFNNGGLAAALPRLAQTPRLGVNVGANSDSSDPAADYAAAVAAVGRRAGWITLNVSSPNTPGLRRLQGAPLGDLLAAAREARGPDGPPLFVKLAPDFPPGALESAVDDAIAAGAQGLIVSNTSLARPPGLGPRGAEPGGLSGAPLAPLALDALKRAAAAAAGRVPLVAAGGIGSLDDVLGRLTAGARAVQLYTAFVYEGPALARRLNQALANWLSARGLTLGDLGQAGVD